MMFDLDGTLYEFNENSFRDTSIYLDLKKRSIQFISEKLKVSEEQAGNMYNLVAQKYNFIISTGFQKEYGLDRNEYLNFAWDMDPSHHIQKNDKLSPFFLELSRNNNLFILSDAPLIWINKILEYFQIKKYFKRIFSGGDMDLRKKGELYPYVLKTLNIDAKNSVMIGDEYLVDVIIPKKYGIKTIFLGKESKGISNYKVKNIFEIKNLL